MDKLLESLDEAIFTPELKVQIQELFESKIEAIKEESEAKLAEEIEATEAKAKEYAEYVKEAHEAKAKEYAEYVKEEMETTLSAYIARVVEDFVEENKIVIEESVENAKLRALLEGFDSMLKTGSVYLSDIVETKTETEAKTDESLEALKAQISELVKESATLKAEKAELVKESIFAEVTADLTLVEKAKLEKLAKFVKFNESDLDAYKKALVEFKEEVTDKIAEPAVVAEKVDEAVVDAVEKDKTYSRFV
jgi:hypothetical protein